jgi:hypothetical protein
MAQIAQIETPINAAQKVIGWDVIFKCGFHDHPDTHSTNIRTLIPR